MPSTFMTYKSVEHFRQVHPDLTWITPDSASYAKRREIYRLDNICTPLAIAVPKSAEDVAAIVRLARQLTIPFTIRSGGHDIFGRSIVQDAICIDLRDINFVEVSSDRKSARVGGGILMGQLLDVLEKDGLVAACGSVPDVGYFSWASLTGYGPLSTGWGLGVDQIVEVEAVNADGEIVSADANLLTGFRGGGGHFGVAVSLWIKVFELKTILAGVIIFDPSAKDLGPTYTDLVHGIQSLQADGRIPPHLDLIPSALWNAQMGHFVACSFAWLSSDHVEGRRHLDVIAGLGTVMANTASETTVAANAKQIGTFVPKGTWGEELSLRFRNLSPKVLGLLEKGIYELQEPNNGIGVHILGSESPSITEKSYANASCLNPDARQAHLVLELYGSSVDRYRRDKSVDWANKLYDELVASGEVMDSDWAPLAKPGTGSERLFGQNWKLVKDLKEKHDPEGIFSLAVPGV